jgi:hypothetical protein
MVRGHVAYALLLYLLGLLVRQKKQLAEVGRKKMEALFQALDARGESYTESIALTD